MANGELPDQYVDLPRVEAADDGLMSFERIIAAGGELATHTEYDLLLGHPCLDGPLADTADDRSAQRGYPIVD